MALFADALCDAMAAGRSAGRSFLLVNTAAVAPDEVHRLLSPEDTAFDLMHGTMPNWHRTASPLLLQCPTAKPGSPTAIRWRSLAVRWRYANALLLIQSSRPFDALATALAARTRVRLEDQTAEWVLRYFDTRVWFPLMQTLPAQERQQFLSVGTKWTAGDRWGEAHAFDGVQVDTARFAPPLRLQPSQETALVQAAEGDAMIDLLLQRGQPKLMQLLPPEQHACITQALVQADAHQLLEWPDRVMYCNLFLHLGPSFDQASPWREVLAAHASGQRPFAKGCEAACEALEGISA